LIQERRGFACAPWRADVKTKFPQCMREGKDESYVVGGVVDGRKRKEKRRKIL
jgi:hypothetical protein